MRQLNNRVTPPPLSSCSLYIYGRRLGCHRIPRARVCVGICLSKQLFFKQKTRISGAKHFLSPFFFVDGCICMTRDIFRIFLHSYALLRSSFSFVLKRTQVSLISCLQNSDSRFFLGMVVPVVKDLISCYAYPSPSSCTSTTQRNLTNHCN